MKNNLLKNNLCLFNVNKSSFYYYLHLSDVKNNLLKYYLCLLDVNKNQFYSYSHLLHLN